MLPNYVSNWLRENAFKYPNVIGYSNILSIPEIDGKFDKGAGKALRFYVRKKVNIHDLLPREIIPIIVDIRHLLKKYTFETDIINLGDVRANPPIPLNIPSSEINKTVNFRPVELGVSVGNEFISAGSLGMLYIVLEDYPAYGVYKGDVLAGSNAHIVSPNAGYTREEVIISKKLNILQRGAHHGGKVPNDVVGQYVWHQRVEGIEYESPQPPSTCQIAGGIARSLNTIAGTFGRNARLMPISLNIPNTIDFGLYKPSVEHIMKIADNSIDLSNKFGGHLFAGSTRSGIFFHISEALKRCPIKIKPLNNNYGNFKVGDIIKGCSFWCNYEDMVIDDDATVNIGYNPNSVPFNKLGVMRNYSGVIKGGWSGSGWFKTGEE